MTRAKRSKAPALFSISREFTPAQVARRLGLALREVYRLIEGPLDAFVRPNGRLYVTSEQLERYCRGGR